SAELQRGLTSAQTLRAHAETGGQRLAAGATVADALRRPAVTFADVADRFEPPLDPQTGERVAIEIKIAGYVQRQQLAIEKAEKAETTTIPDDFDYAGIAALSREAREKLSNQRPRTLGSAGRIPGVTPSDVAIVGLFVHRVRHAAPA
ncbi:MAG TPA: hypothetical protein VJP76_02110, partial [Candidatus Tumulicola sp.]|nr:hypothetical protein [Candidatus Tumulicola sp.]